MSLKLYISNRKHWRKWLRENQSIVKEVWLIYYKKHTGKPTIPYDDAVEEALCFGWIDSTIKRIDDEKYCQKFTPRNDKSNWSEHNKKRVAKMIKQGKMTKAGMDKIYAAKKNGEWNKKIVTEINFEMPSELSQLLSSNKKAKDFFNELSPSHKKQYIGWIASAKKNATREKRAREAINLLKSKQKLGMK
jgi:uncharacterized protein YdeI (YjbR/CyaY-like superfamily)